jgi:hypothetical protein
MQDLRSFLMVIVPVFLLLWWTSRAKWGAPMVSIYVMWGILLLKTVVGVIYLEWHHRVFGVCDSDAYLRTIKIFNSTLPHHPGHYLEFLFFPGGEYLPPDLWYYIKHTRFWSDKGMMLFIKILSFCSLLGQGKVVWTIFWYNVIGMLGPVYLLKRLSTLFKHESRWEWMLLFLLPQFLFWGSGLHKEGLVVSLQCFAVGAFMDLLGARLSLTSIKSLSLYTFLGSMSVLLLIRGYDAVMLVIVFILFFVRSWRLLPAVFLALVVVMYVGEWMGIGIGNYMVQKQQAYLHNGVVVSAQQVLDLNGHSVWSFVRNIPQALFFALIGKPGMWSEKVYFVYQLIMFFLMIMLMIRRVTNEWTWRFISIAFLQMTFIGWVVTNQGSVVRYASIPWFWLGLTMISLYLSVKRKQKES